MLYKFHIAMDRLKLYLHAEKIAHLQWVKTQNTFLLDFTCIQITSSK